MEDKLFLKGDIMIKRMFLKKILFIVFLFVSLVSVSQGGDIAYEPIIEGESIAGLRIGDTEDKILQVIQKSSLKLIYAGEDAGNEKLISFGNMTEEGGLAINVFLRDGKIITIEVISVPVKGRHFYNGKTKKGVSFGDSYKLLVKLYGEPYKKWGNIYWYKNEGIMFGIVGTGIEVPPNAVNNITIMPANSELISSIRGRGLH